MGKQLLPPDKRKPNNISFITCLLSPLQWIRDLWFGSYRTGSTAPAWNSGTTYSKYAQVIYNKVVYESLQDGNTNNTPIIGSTYWTAIQQNFIGLSERIIYNGQTLVITYAMNKWFGTTFRQPNQKNVVNYERTSNVATIKVLSHGYSTGQIVQVRDLSDNSFNGVFKITGVTTNTFTYANVGSDVATTVAAGIASILSDIYILNNSLGILPFIVGGSEAISSVVYADHSSEFIIDGYSFANRINFTIYVPVAVYNALSAISGDRDKIFRAFVNEYIPAGLTYNIQTY